MNTGVRKLEKELRPMQGDITEIKLRLVHKEQALLSVYDEAYPEIPLIAGKLNRREVCRLSSALAELAIHMRNSP
ncbi:MAG: hypothetical protein HZA88_04840 [Verrucomicrobia bacterium]|nr:hypothetical protein [Verrucomicrobiota bacterium]